MIRKIQFYTFLILILLKEPSFSVGMRPVYRSAYEYPDKIAVIDDNGRYTYKSVLSASTSLANKLLESVAHDTLFGERIAFLCNQDVAYIIAQWSCWLNGSVCVPLCQDHPPKVLEYYINDAKASLLISTDNFEAVLRPLAENFNIPLVIITPEYLKLSMVENETIENVSDIFSNSTDDGLIIYTSGTTGPPKVTNNIIYMYIYLCYF